MKFFFSLLSLVLSLSLGAQGEIRPTSFHVELDLFATRPLMIEAEGDLSNRYSTGGGLNFVVRRMVSAGLSFEAGVGVQQFGVRQRDDLIQLGCNIIRYRGTGAPPSYAEAKISLAGITMHVAPILHLNRAWSGVYLKPRLRVNYNIDAATNGYLHECGNDDGRSVNIGRASGKKLSVFPGLGVGYQREIKNGKVAYLELNMTVSGSRLYRRTEDAFAEELNFWRASGALFGGITIGWQIGSGIKKS